MHGCRESAAQVPAEPLALPAPAPSKTSLDDALRQRRSVRSFERKPLTADQLSALLFAAQGVTDDEGHRTAPSAGALYPLELYVLTAEGTFHYEPSRHVLIRTGREDNRDALARAAHDQDAVREAPAVFVFTGVIARTAGKYGARADRYVFLEAGHAAQNLLLEAAALKLAGVPIGAFEDAAVRAAVGCPADFSALYLVPVGRPR